MRGKWFWLSVVAVFLLLGVIGLAVWKYVGTGEELTNEFDPAVSEQTESKGLPEELTSGFDPTVNEVMFVIEAADPQGKSLRLRGVFPPGWENRRHESKIICREEDIRIVYKSGKELTGSVALFEVIEKTSKQNMMFGGKCADSACAEINRECVLFVAGEEGSGL